MDTERLHLKPLAACLTAMLAWGPAMTSAEPAAAAVPAHPPGQGLLHGMLHDLRVHGTRPGAARAWLAMTRAAPDRPAGTIPVTNCADDGDGSLRAAVASAVSGDTIDMSTLTCGTITLTTGQISVYVDDLTIQGPGQDTLTIDGNQADRVIASYGAVLNPGALAINDLTIANGLKGGATPNGGCVYTYAYNPYNALALNRVTVTGCTAGDDSTTEAVGGGIRAFGTLALYYSTLSNNQATGPAGSFYVAGAALVTYQAAIGDSTISGNSAVGQMPGSGLGEGGSLVSSSSADGSVGSTIFNSTISNNQAEYYGGLVLQTPNGGGADFPVTDIITNSTISGNTSLAGGAAGLVDSYNPSITLVLRNSTIAFNTNAYGCAGVDTANPTNDFESSIIANNTGAGGAEDDLCGTGAIGGANNLIMVSALAVPGDTISADPLLGPLQDNGGLTFTHALLAGSPAIDAGNNLASLDFDQRGNGFPRVVGAAADIGAYEVQPDDTIFANGFDP